VIDLVAKVKALVEVNSRAAAARSIEADTDNPRFGQLGSRVLNSKSKSIFLITNFSFSVVILKNVIVRDKSRGIVWISLISQKCSYQKL